ncbi:hypothetical protein GCK72_016767 [Caenorhabditis remanei]|uniref:Uncharacterized protein n=1 Tax=Caenorhabditis remanei TaxID=31234 RepID=A0A6A5G5I3_CAERE|nr:hypothetical protein GCK72_016767 [Caenorhabditis remanei]KAF1750220.1 hypothetical protein GCK72_016767 [Caenorhabditis remanei]
MRLLVFCLLFIIGMATCVISSDQEGESGHGFGSVNDYLAKRAYMDEPGEIRPLGVTGNPKFVRQTDA